MKNPISYEGMNRLESDLPHCFQRRDAAPTLKARTATDNREMRPQPSTRKLELEDASFKVGRWKLPTLICEVLSPSTEAIDRREKKLNYQQSSTLEEYVVVAHDRRGVTIFRRANDWIAETVTSAGTPIEFRSLKQTLTLEEIYEDVNFSTAAAS